MDGRINKIVRDRNGWIRGEGNREKLKGGEVNSWKKKTVIIGSRKQNWGSEIQKFIMGKK